MSRKSVSGWTLPVLHSQLWEMLASQHAVGQELDYSMYLDASGEGVGPSSALGESLTRVSLYHSRM